MEIANKKSFGILMVEKLAVTFFLTINAVTNQPRFDSWSKRIFNFIDCIKLKYFYINIFQTNIKLTAYITKWQMFMKILLKNLINEIVSY